MSAHPLNAGQAYAKCREARHRLLDAIGDSDPDTISALVVDLEQAAREHGTICGARMFAKMAGVALPDGD